MRLILLLFLIVTYCSLSQNIRFFNTDISQYPFVKSNVVVFNDNGEQITDLDPSSLTISENGNLAEVLSLSCSEPEPPEPLSGVLMVDISTSMEGDPIELAKLGALSWINFKRPSSETSIVGFSDKPFLLSDYSHDKPALEDVINSLELFGGTDVNRSFLEERTGSLDIAARGNNKKVIILLTDGIASVNEQEIIKKANDIGAQIFCIVLFNEATSQLRSISNATGGFIYDDVSSETEIINIYRTIFKVSESLANCEVTFRSLVCEIDRKLQISYGDTLFGRHEYQAVSEILPQLNYPLGQFITFNNITQGNDETASIIVEADFFDIVITDIKSSNSFFTIEFPTQGDLPLTISEGTTEQIRVNFNYQTDKFEVAEIEIVSNACLNEIFYASGGAESATPGENSIEVLIPNGGELYASGTSGTVTWGGTLPTDKIKVELTTNAGEDWQTFTNEATNLSYNINFPDIESDECLVRLTQFSEEFGKLYLEANTDTDNVNAVSWSPLGKIVSAANVDGSIRQMDAFNGEVSLVIDAHDDEVKDVVWSTDGIRLASVSFDSTLKIWNTLLNQELFSLKAHNDKINCLAWSSDGQFIATGGQDDLIKIWDGNTYDLVETLDYHTQEINTLKFSPNNEYLASGANDSLVKIIEVSNWEVLNSWKAENSDIRDVDWLNDSEIIACSDRNNDNAIKHWDIDANLIKEREINEQVYAISINREDELIAIGGASGITYLWQTQDFSTEIDYPISNIWRIEGLDWSPDGSRFASGIYGKLSEITMQFYSTNRFPTAQDVSDDYFSLLNPDISLDDINLGQYPVDRILEETRVSFFRNNNNLSTIVNKIEIINDISDVFDLQYDLSEGNILKAKFYFSPKQDVTYIANLRVYTNIGEFTSQITGSGVLPDLNDAELDFGDVVVNTNESNTISLINTSGIELEIISANIINANASNFEILNQNSTNLLADGEELLFEIDFAPDTPTFENSILRIEHNGKNSPSIISLLGRGIEPGLNFNLPDTLYYSCYSDNLFNLEFSNKGIGTLDIIDGLVYIGDLDFSLSNLNLTDGASEIISVDYSNWDQNSPLIINFTTNNGEFNFEIPIRELISSFSFNFGNSTNFFQNAENIPETNLISLVNDGETNLEFSQSFPIQLRNGLITINYTGPLVLNLGENTDLSVDFSSGNFGNFGLETFSLIEKCGFESELSINWNIQSDSDPIIVQQSNKFDDLVCIEKDTVRIPIQNSSANAVNLILDSFDNPDLKFNILNLPQNVPANSSRLIEVEFSTIQAGSFSSTINLSYADLKKSIEFTAKKETVDYEFNLPSLTFESGELGEVIIENLGSLPIDIPVGSTYQGFQIVSANPRLIGLQESSTIEVGYIGLLKEDSTQITFDFGCGTGDSLFVKSLDSTKFFVNIALPEIDANIGDIINLEANIETNFNFDNLNFSLNYNKTLLKYLGNNLATKNNKLETVFYSDINSNNVDLGNFQVLWGNDSITSLEINEINILDINEDYTANSTNGNLRVIDLCYEGGVRLYYSPELVIKLGPNPTTKLVSLNYSSSNKIDLSYKLKSLITGELILESKIILSGTGNHLIDLSNYPSGAYYLEIKSDIYSDNIKLIKH